MSTQAYIIKFDTNRALPRTGHRANLSNQGRRTSEVTKSIALWKEENVPERQPFLQHSTNQACMLEQAD